MTNVTIEAGTLTASRADRVVSGLLLPYGEVGRTNLGRFSIEPGTIDVPTEDPSAVTLYSPHVHEKAVGRALTLTVTKAGVVGSFGVARTPAGDAYLDDVEAGRKPALSAEVEEVVIRDGKSVGGRLFAAAGVKAGAFPSALLMAEDVGEEPEQTTEDDEPSDEAPDGAESEATVAETQTAPEVEQDEQETTTETDGELRASLPGSVNGKAKSGSTAKTLFASLRGKNLQEAGTMLAALDQATATDLLPSQQQQWLGEVGSKRTYARMFVPLVQHGDLAGLKAIGWRFQSGKTPQVAAYTGYPNQPNSNVVATEQVTLDASRLAGAGSVDRAFLDFPSSEFWGAYFREQGNSYDRQLDGIVRAFLIASATHLDADAVPTDVAVALSYIVDGAFQIITAERGMPSFALVGADLWKPLMKTRQQDAAAYLSGALNLDAGQLEGFRIVPSADANLTGKVVVGTGDCATVYELPGVPVRVDAVNIAVGGAERGVFGYHAELLNDAAGLVEVSPAA